MMCGAIIIWPYECVALGLFDHMIVCSMIVCPLDCVALRPDGFVSVWPYDCLPSCYVALLLFYLKIGWSSIHVAL